MTVREDYLALLLKERRTMSRVMLTLKPSRVMVMPGYDLFGTKTTAIILVSSGTLTVHLVIASLHKRPYILTSLFLTPVTHCAVRTAMDYCVVCAHITIQLDPTRLLLQSLQGQVSQLAPFLCHFRHSSHSTAACLAYDCCSWNHQRTHSLCQHSQCQQRYLLPTRCDQCVPTDSVPSLAEP